VRRAEYPCLLLLLAAGQAVGCSKPDGGTARDVAAWTILQTPNGFPWDLAGSPNRDHPCRIVANVELDPVPASYRARSAQFYGEEPTAGSRLDENGTKLTRPRIFHPDCLTWARVARLWIQIDTKGDEPEFTAIVSNTSRSEGEVLHVWAGDMVLRCIQIVVFKNGRRLWLVEPFERLTCASLMSCFQRVDLLPGQSIGVSFSISGKYRRWAETLQALGEFLPAEREFMKNPFGEAATYAAQLEARLYIDEAVDRRHELFEARLFSNRIVFRRD
jgi:hypothetical protein